MNNIDKTIDEICVWIQKELKSCNKKDYLPEMTKALAELVRARADEKTTIQ